MNLSIRTSILIPAAAAAAFALTFAGAVYLHKTVPSHSSAASIEPVVVSQQVHLVRLTNIPPATHDPKLLQLAMLEAGMKPSALVSRWNPLIAASARRFHVPEAWIRAVVMAESGGRTVSEDGKPIVSRVGAMGLMQVMPQTYAEMRTTYGLGSDPFNARDNIMAGTAYLRWLQGRYGYPAMFAAYNAGPGRLEDHLMRGEPLPAETIAYVTRVSGGSDSIGLAKLKQVQLTKPDGSPVTVDPNIVDSVRAALPDEFAPGVHAVLKMGKRMQGVRENIATVQAMLRRKSSST